MLFRSKKGNYISRILVYRISERIKTIDKLVEFMEREYYCMDAFSIGKYRTTEDLFLDWDGKNYIYGYSERGHREIEKTFNEEAEAVKYVDLDPVLLFIQILIYGQGCFRLLLGGMQGLMSLAREHHGTSRRHNHGPPAAPWPRVKHLWHP